MTDCNIITMIITLLIAQQCTTCVKAEKEYCGTCSEGYAVAINDPDLLYRM